MIAVISETLQGRPLNRNTRVALRSVCVSHVTDTSTVMSASNNNVVVIVRDGGWCWFQSPLAVILDHRLLIGSVSSGYINGRDRVGDVEIIEFDISTHKSHTSTLYERLEVDDHDAPAIYVRRDGGLVTMFTKHSLDNTSYYRISPPPLTSLANGAAYNFGRLLTFIPSESSRVTYSNIYRLSGEKNRVYNFYRGLDDSYKPSFAYSDDDGATWQSGNIIIRVPSTEKHRPYVRYASNGIDSVHLFYTEAHPRDFDNSLFHVIIRGGRILASDGTDIAALTDGLEAPDRGTRVFTGDRDHVGWCTDVCLDQSDRPVGIYTVQVGSAGLPVGSGGDDIRYRYTRWDGKSWRDFPLAYAGTRLYSGEDDYSGLAAIEPDNINIVYISTNAQPDTGEPLISSADNKRHYEIFRGETSDGGETWQWTAITTHSSADNLRPLRPKSNSAHRALIWLRGSYRTYTDYSQDVVGIFWKNGAELS